MKNRKSVFKYRSCGVDSEDEKRIFERDLKSLINNEIYAPTRETLNDPCEGFVSIDILLNQIDKMVKINQSVKEDFNNVKNKLNNMISHNGTSGVYSLSTNHLDELLWAHYANSHKGFCIEYDLDMLLKLNREMVPPRKELLAFDVVYQDKPYHLTDTDMNDLQDTTSFMSKILGYKSNKWEYENEVRIICSKPGAIEYDYRALKSIYFGLRMNDKEQNKIMRELQGRGIRYYKIKLKNNSYIFEAEPIEDKYKTNKKYLYSIAQVEECAIKDIDYNNIYIKKAIEIVKREPYCNSIIYIKDNNSSVEVSFFKEHHIVLKQEYSYQEIDKLYEDILDLDKQDIKK
jgi:hypothetical protein